MQINPWPSSLDMVSGNAQDSLTGDQLTDVKQHFRRHIENGTGPKKKDCESLLEKEPVLLQGKHWQKLN